jgi:hypothetical protein
MRIAEQCFGSGSALDRIRLDQRIGIQIDQNRQKKEKMKKFMFE